MNESCFCLTLSTQYTISHIHTHITASNKFLQKIIYIFIARDYKVHQLMKEGNNLPKQGIEGQIFVKTCMSLHHLSVLLNVMRTNICYAEKTSYFSPPDLFILYPSYINS